MTLKEVARRRIPRFLKPAALAACRLVQARHYYVPYVLQNGRVTAPRRLQFEITYRCNLRCVMCPLALSFDDPNSRIARGWREEVELTTDEIRRMIDDAAQVGVKDLGITGGEPFSRKDVIDVVRHAKSRGLTCNVISNGTFIDEQRAEMMVEAGLDGLALSLDGPEPVHTRIRGNARAYDKTVDAARYVERAKRRAGSSRPGLTLTCTVTAANMDELVPLVDVAHEVNAKLGYGYMFYTAQDMIEQTNAILPLGAAKGECQDVPDELKAVDPGRLHQETRRVKRRAARLGVPTHFSPDLTRDQIRRRFHDDNYAYVRKCFYPWFAVRVNPYGQVYPCSMNVTMGSVREEPLSEIWNNDTYVKFRRTLKREKLFPRCAKCCALSNKLWDYLPG